MSQEEGADYTLREMVEVLWWGALWNQLHGRAGFEKVWFSWSSVVEGEPVQYLSCCPLFEWTTGGHDGLIVGIQRGFSLLDHEAESKSGNNDEINTCSYNSWDRVAEWQWRDRSIILLYPFSSTHFSNDDKTFYKFWSKQFIFRHRLQQTDPYFVILKMSLLNRYLRSN